MKRSLIFFLRKTQLKNRKHQQSILWFFSSVKVYVCKENNNDNGGHF